LTVSVCGRVADRSESTALNQVIDERLRDGCVLGRAFHQCGQMLDALPIDPDRFSP
jgi:hypothetical protein